MFFKTRFYKQLDTKSLVFTSDTRISISECIHKNYIERTFKEKVTEVAKEGELICDSITFAVGFPKELEDYLGDKITANSEQYAVILGKESYVFAKDAKALIFGHYSLEPSPVIDDILARIGNRYNIPVIRNEDFGHGANGAIFPISVKAKLNTEDMSFQLLESGVK